MTILYLRYCAIYPPQVVLQNETNKNNKGRMCLLVWKESHGNTLNVVPSALTHSLKALKKKKNNVGKFYPEYNRADAVFHA